jgi:hypothetical protein
LRYVILSHTQTAVEQRFTVLVEQKKGVPLVDVEGGPVWCRFGFGLDCAPEACAAEMKAQLAARYGPSPAPALPNVDLTGTEL